MHSFVDLPLHGGKVPRWLFYKMKKLGYAILRAVELEYGSYEVIRRLSDPLWFQALSCVLGYDWHSSGTTTVTLAALREALAGSKSRLRIAGGKALAFKTPKLIEKYGKELKLTERDVQELKKYSKYSAKADSMALLDGFFLYHHSIIFDDSGVWAVIQQGMRQEWARRYHIFEPKSFEEDTNSAIASDFIAKNVVDLLNKRSRDVREVIPEVVGKAPKYFQLLRGQATLTDRPIVGFKMPVFHTFSKNVYKNLLKLKKENIQEFVDLYNTPVGPKTMRALVLISEIIFDVSAVKKDPVKYSFAHGGKDGVPFPVDRRTYSNSIALLEEAIEKAELGKKEKLEMLKKLSRKV